MCNELAIPTISVTLSLELYKNLIFGYQKPGNEGYVWDAVELVYISLRWRNIDKVDVLHFSFQELKIAM